MDFDLTGLMRRENISAVKMWPGGRISVELRDGEFGCGETVEEALAVAKTGETNIRRVTA